MEEGEDAEVFLPKIELTDPRAVELESTRRHATRKGRRRRRVEATRLTKFSTTKESARTGRSAI